MRALAAAFPAAEVVGVDPDAESIARARQTSQARFVVGELSAVERGAGFDLITLCDVLHDLAEPVETLEQARALLKRDATLFIIEPKAADRLEDNRNPVATTFYGFSLFHCMTQRSRAAAGTRHLPRARGHRGACAPGGLHALPPTGHPQPD